jgi:hypothetical protein
VYLSGLSVRFIKGQTQWVAAIGSHCNFWTERFFVSLFEDDTALANCRPTYSVSVECYVVPRVLDLSPGKSLKELIDEFFNTLLDDESG